MKKPARKISKPSEPHCVLDQLLNAEEMELAQALFRQQGIQIKESRLIARIRKAGSRKECAFRYHLAPGVDYCASESHLKKMRPTLKKKKR